MWCAWVIALFFFVNGIRMIGTQKGFEISKEANEVQGKKAIGYGGLSLFIGLSIVALILLGMFD